MINKQKKKIVNDIEYQALAQENFVRINLVRIFNEANVNCWSFTEGQNHEGLGQGRSFPKKKKKVKLDPEQTHKPKARIRPRQV